MWQNSRSALHGASGLSQLLTSTARTSRHRRLWARQRGQCPPQPSGTDTVQRVVQGTVAAPVFGQQRQVHRRPGRAVGAQQRVRELKQFIAACVQARVDLTPGGPFR